MIDATQLEVHAKNIRREILTMSYNAQSAHTGGALSCVEILVALYFKILQIDPLKPLDADRDRLIFSKAHDAKALYAVLAEKGFFAKELLEGYEKTGGKLPGHSTRNCVPGVEVSAGSLGHGLSMAAGVAYAGKMDNKSYKTFAVLSDGECDEGSTWEAALWSGHHKLENLTAVVDYNKLQGFGLTKDVLDLEPFADKWTAFGWQVQEVDGHNMEELVSLLSGVPLESNKPSVVLAHTIKGKGGIPKYENEMSSQYYPPTKEEFEEIMENLR